jgi:uncharacterized protein YdhG (YjbR/CyaY superfamily)
MAKTDSKSVDGYLAAQPEAVRAILQRVRGAIRKALPGADEVISYQIPAYCLHGTPVIWFAGWKQHFSIYPATGSVATELADELARYAVSKGTIRFPLGEPVPVRLIQRIAKLRARDAAEKAQAKAAKTGKRAR